MSNKNASKKQSDQTKTNPGTPGTPGIPGTPAVPATLPATLPAALPAALPATVYMAAQVCTAAEEVAEAPFQPMCKWLKRPYMAANSGRMDALNSKI